jgi:hypothetical protein
MFKRIFAAVLLCAVLLLPAAVFGNEIAVTVNGEAVVFGDVSPTIIGGSTMVPLRDVFYAMGFAVDWDVADATATIHNAETTMVLRQGDEFFTVNGVRNTPEVPPQIVNGRFMLPLRAVAEAAGADVFWDGATSTVIILHGAERLPEPVRVPIPADRRMTDGELAAWTAGYHTNGGPNEFEQEVFRLVNAERAAYGLAPLVMSDTMMISARFKSQAMYDMSYFSHTNPVYGAFQNIPERLFGYNFPPLART